MAIRMRLTKEMVYEVMDAWEREHPGKDAPRDMPPGELGRRVMEKIKATATETGDEVRIK